MLTNKVECFDQFSQHFIHTPSTSWIVGASGSGKTTLLRDLLSNWTNITRSQSPKIEQLVICFACWQPEYDQIIEKIGASKVKIFNEFPASVLQNSNFWQLKDPEAQNILIIDDLSDQFVKSPEFQQLHEVLGHHSKINIFILLQDLWKPSPVLRGALRNTHYLFLLPSNSCIGGTLVNLQKHFFPSQGGLLTYVYRDCFENHKQRYLLIDNSLDCPYKYRLRSGLLPTEDSLVFQPTNV